MDVHRQGWLCTYPSPAHGVTYEAVAARVDAKEVDRFARWTESLANQNEASHIWVARVQGQIVGFCHSTREQGINRIRSIYILPEHQGKGIGSQLLRQAIDWLGRKQDIMLEVVAYNERAIRFYQKLGFVRGKTVDQESDGSTTWLNMPEIEMYLPAERSD